MLEFLCGLWDHPDTDTALVLAGAGCERALRRVPALASRVLTWELVPRLRPGEVATVMAAFHPLWEDVTEADVAWVDEHVGHGNFRTWAELTSHLTRGDLWQEPCGGGPPVAGAGLRTTHGANVTGASRPGEAGGHEDGPHARGGLPSSSLSALRGPAVRRLLALREDQKLTTRHVRLMAGWLEVTERTVWRWLAAAERDESAAAEPGVRAQSKDRFSVTPEVRRLLALWKGNVAAVHRELTARAARGEGRRRLRRFRRCIGRSVVI
ncbi:hypothetical protein [Streptomyces sp. TP-A0356]|uniref:hypothetical protein n=1 Tax=Streptomyces sp. TP-A0356 TaxID=1359208 RepID=UPI0006E2827A|nr:hypothetical protein [Streptomyces sp. TP-A0356]